MELWLQRQQGRLPQHSRLFGRACGILLKTEPFQTTDKFAGNRHFTFVIHLGHEGLLLLQSPQQNAGAPINKSLRQRGMERI